MTEKNGTDGQNCPSYECTMSASTTNYDLLDFGEGRKLERFGDVVLDRPCPAAEGRTKSRRELWKDAAAAFDGDRVSEGEWRSKAKTWVPNDWCFLHESAAKFRLGLDALPSGQVGVFPEQR